jgi:hypothetical protein
MKKKVLLIVTSVVFMAALTCLMSCEGCGVKPKTVSKDIPLNISVYLDLSDRLVRGQLTPSQKDRDMAIVQNVADILKKKSFGPKLLQCENHLKVFFYPTPNNSEITTLAEKLEVDLASLQAGKKKTALQTMSGDFAKSLDQIYTQTIKTSKWTGSDIWGFFSNKVVDTQCIRKGNRNILIILTDGYIFDANNKVNEGNAYSYILPETLVVPNSKLMAKRKGLGNLEVLMLEVNPYKQTDREKMIHVLETWFKEMGVKKFAVADTDLPTTTKTVIDNFLN